MLISAVNKEKKSGRCDNGKCAWGGQGQHLWGSDQVTLP